VLQASCIGDVPVFTSTLQRTIQTAAHLPFPQQRLPALDEINAGICEHMTYEQVQQRYPAVHEARSKDKLGYRWVGRTIGTPHTSRLLGFADSLIRCSRPCLIVSVLVAYGNQRACLVVAVVTLAQLVFGRCSRAPRNAACPSVDQHSTTPHVLHLFSHNLLLSASLGLLLLLQVPTRRVLP
jgi:hypothetical protein